MKAANEAPVLRDSLRLLQMRGIMAWRNNNQGVFDPSTRRFRAFSGLPGVADVLGVLPSGRFLAVETKRPGVPAMKVAAGRLTPEQRDFLVRVNLNGGVGVMINDVARLDSVLQILEVDPWARFTIEGERSKANWR